MTSILLAQDAPKQAAPEMGLFNPMTMMVVMFALFFLVVMLPAQRRQRREQEQMMASMKRGSRIVTSAGILGTIEGLKENEDEITVRSGDAKLKILKSSVARVLGQEDSETK